MSYGGDGYGDNQGYGGGGGGYGDNQGYGGGGGGRRGEYQGEHHT
jgi:hypothetical protein